MRPLAQWPVLRVLLLAQLLGAALGSTIVACPTAQRTKALSFSVHEAPSRPSSPACGPIALSAKNLTLHQWNVGLLRMLLARKRMTPIEKVQVKRKLGGRYAHAGPHYMTLKHTLHFALEDPDFQRVAVQRQGMWLEFGVLTGLSINITSMYLDLLTGLAPATVVDGFDTFTGLPEAWPNGKGGFYYKKGSFSWAARKRGSFPPVRSRVRLHKGLFNDTLPPFLEATAPRGRPLAWANIDCDLYAGTRDALGVLSPHICRGTRLHFHELLKDRYWKAKRLAEGNHNALVPSEEARALYEWLRAHPSVELELLDVVSQVNSDAAAFRVLRAPDAAASTCA